jgi:hypothetical protein
MKHAVNPRFEFEPHYEDPMDPVHGLTWSVLLSCAFVWLPVLLAGVYMH